MIKIAAVVTLLITIWTGKPYRWDLVGACAMYPYVSSDEFPNVLLFLDSKSQCSGRRGTCPDSKLQVS